MPRARNIKFSFFSNEYLADVSPHARLLFIGLWTLADRNGLLEERLKRIKAELFAYEDVNILELLLELENAGDDFIERYSVSGKDYISIVNFTEHQNPHKNEKAKNLPFPSDSKTDSGASTVQAPEQHPSRTLVAPDCSNHPEMTSSENSSCAGKFHDPNRSPTGKSNATKLPFGCNKNDSTNKKPTASEEHHTSTVQAPEQHPSRTLVAPERSGGMRNEESGKRTHENSTRAKVVNELFQQFYDSYPRKLKPDNAKKAWTKAIRTADPELIIAKAKEYAESPMVKTTEKQFIPYPATWLNSGSWNDDPTEWQTPRAEGKENREPEPQYNKL